MIGIKSFVVLWALVFAGLAQAAQTGDFKVQGQVASFHYTAPSDGVPRTIVYYLPRSIQNPWNLSEKHSTMFFMHGGGASTQTDVNATRVALQYIQDFLQYAEDRRVILILPTTSVGWSYHTSYLFRSLIPYVEKQIAVDPNHLVLAGHSMGGMGITREYPWMTDLFSGVLGLAAGINPVLYNENYTLAYLNGTPYTHINGEKDAFTTFKPWMVGFQDYLKTVEAKYHRQSNFKLLFHPGGHNYDMKLTTAELDHLFAAKRIYYPKYMEIQMGLVHYAATAQLPGLDGARDHAYWVKELGAPDPGPQAATNLFMNVQANQNVITMFTRDNTLKPTGYELTLAPELVDFTKPVKVLLNSFEVFNGMVDLSHDQLHPKLQVKVPQSLDWLM